ncbi:MAG: hypothetical protein M4579_001560 [Chaenotheca gracillima]|nr:MAG: hypothetical protein M4579_001560 [Chaenotheca gracillima]
MPSQLLNPNEYELTGPSSSDSDEDFNLDEADPTSAHASLLGSSPANNRSWVWLPVRLWSFLPSLKRRSKRQPRSRQKSRPVSTRTCVRRRGVRHICFLVAGAIGVVLALVILTSVLKPSYTSPPAHYEALRHRASRKGNANPNDEKVFIAANIIDEDLIRGAWGKAVLELVDLLGERNVFLSVYENDSGPGTKAALEEFKEKVTCNSSIVSEHLPLEDIDSITLPNGEKRIKRVAYLAEVRNRALWPLDPKRASDQDASGTTFGKLLFLNDIVFSPLDAAQLLFSTNLDADGFTRYRAACAVDFINPFKFYDTFATRDLEGFSMGVPFFPWFSRAGSFDSRQDVLAGKDAVRVRSCWGGMVAFEAKWFQHANPEEGLPKPAEPAEADTDRNLNWHLNDPSIVPRAETGPVRFRSEKDTYWDASECCLIHADIQPVRPHSDPTSETGIYVNPFIRVAYDERTFGWLGITRRWERLYSIPHHIVNLLAGLPFDNTRRKYEEGDEVLESVWKQDGEDRKGSYDNVQRTAGRGEFCGTRKLLVLRENPKEGEKKWESLPVPRG